MPGSVFHVLTSPVADVTGTVTVFNASGGTKTEAASNIVRPSDWNSSHAVTFNAVGSEISGAFSNTPGGVTFGLETNGYITAGAPAGGGGITAINVSAGTLSQNLSALTFNNGGGVSFGLAASVVTATVATNYAASDHSHGNPQLNLTNLSGTTASNSAGFTLSLSAGNYLTTAMQSNAATISNINVSAGTTSNNLSALTFANSNGVSFGLNGSVITGTVATNYLTTAALSNHSHGNPTLNLTNLSGTTASNSAGLTLSLSAAATVPETPFGVSAGTQSVSTGTLVFSNSNGITFGMSGSSRITASHNGLTTAAASDHSHGNPTLALTNLSGTTASNSAGFTLSLSAGAGGAGDGGNILAAGTRTAGTNSSVLFDNANGITFGLNAVGGSVMTASHNALTTARASNDAVGLNTAATNVTWTVNSAGISLNGSGYAGTGTTFAGANISGSLTQNSAGINMSLSVAAPGAAAENNWFALTGNTVGNTTASGSTIALSGGNNITLSGTNGSVIRIDAPASSSLVGVAPMSISTDGSTISVYQKHMSVFEPYEFANNTAFSSHGQNTLYIQRLWPEFNYTFANVEKIASLSFVSSTNSQSVAHTIRYGLYSRDTGTNSTRMTQIGSSAVIFIASFASNTNAGYTVSQSGGGSYTTTSAGTGILSQYTAGKIFYLPYAGSMQAGVEYAFGFHVSTASAVGTSPARLSFLELTNLNNTTLGRISPSTVQLGSATIYEEWDGLMHRTTQNGLVASYEDSQCQVAVSRARQYLIFET